MDNFKDRFLAHLGIYIKISQECVEACKVYDAKMEARIASVTGNDEQLFVPWNAKEEMEFAAARECIDNLKTTRHNTGMAMLVLARRLTETDLQALGFTSNKHGRLI